MKKCNWCGKEYPDDVSVCAIDQNPLESFDPAPPAPASDESEGGSVEAAGAALSEEADTDVPDGFRCLGRFDPFEADRLLKEFADAGIRFQIDRIETEVPTGQGYRKISLIEIYVHQDDDENDDDD